ncbi:MAG: TetR/AcrR family transcriptional regulator [Flavobacteriales bacterium]|nr:TetR/AcrR family transcriptional regulator [Flavobacteriales bacterium]
MNPREEWISVGYELFAKVGSKGLVVEQIAKQVGKSKSSFYHYFADIEVFIEFLLNRHWEQAQIMAKKESEVQDKENFVQIIVDHKVDLLFNRQLRVERQISNFEKWIQKIDTVTIPAMSSVWKKIIQLEDNHSLSMMVLKLAMDNFYLQLTPENCNEEWLNAYFQELKDLATALKSQSISLDGSV